MRLRDPVANLLRGIWVSQLIPDSLRNQHTFIQPRKDLDSGDENKLIERSGIGYDSPHLDAEFAKRLAVTLEIFDSVLKLDAPGL